MRPRQPRLARIRRSRRRHAKAGFALVVALALSACGGSTANDTDGGGQPAPLPTPQVSLSAQVQGTVALVRNVLAPLGLRLDPPVAPYRPSEPASLTHTPRGVFQVSIPDRDQGYVVIYELDDPPTAAARGQELASYLGSGFGQTNFPSDAQFSVAQVGSTLVFTWWSKERASDKQAAEGAFDLIRSVGLPIAVTK